MFWLLGGLAAMFGLALVGGVMALILAVRFIAWCILVTIHLARLYFVPTTPPNTGPPSSS